MTAVDPAAALDLADPAFVAVYDDLRSVPRPAESADAPVGEPEPVEAN